MQFDVIGCAALNVHINSEID